MNKIDQEKADKKLVSKQKLRIATPEDKRKWARGITTHKCELFGRLFELVDNNKLYVLKIVSRHTDPSFRAQVKGAIIEAVIDRPGKKIKQLVMDNNYL